MKYCSQCGQQLPDGARFCNKCGATLPDQEVTAADMETEILPADSTSAEPGETGSGNGPGQPMQSNIPPIPAKPQGKGLPVMRTRTIITGIVIALLLVAGGFWSWRSLGSEARVQQKLDLAVKYLSENKFEEAILAYNDAIKIEPKEVKAYQGLAKTYTLQGKYDEAKAAYERGVAAVSTENKPRLRLGLAGMYIDKGDLQEAERYFQEIINENKTYIDAYRGLALVYQQQGNKDKARAILEKGVKENVSDYNAYAALARFYTDSGDKDKALANIVKSLDLEVNQQEAYSVLSDLYKGKWSELINKADSVASSKTAVMLKLFAYYSDKKYSQALTQYKSLEQDTSNLKARVLMAICMFNTGDKAGAESLIKQLTSKKANSWIMADISRYYQLAGDNNLAATWVIKSLAANERNIDAVKIMAEIYSKDNHELTQVTTTRLLIFTWQPLKTLKQDLIKNQIDVPVIIDDRNIKQQTSDVSTNVKDTSKSDENNSSALKQQKPVYLPPGDYLSNYQNYRLLIYSNESGLVKGDFCTPSTIWSYSPFNGTTENMAMNLYLYNETGTRFPFEGTIVDKTIRFKHIPGTNGKSLASIHGTIVVNADNDPVELWITTSYYNRLENGEFGNKGDKVRFLLPGYVPGKSIPPDGYE